MPTRLELFGDTIDKIKEFDPITQRSQDEISAINICPVNFNKLYLDEEDQDIEVTIETTNETAKVKNLILIFHIIQVFKEEFLEKIIIMHQN